MNKGKFFVLEGLDGAGKSHMSKLLAEYLRNETEVIVYREPGSTDVGEKIRSILKSDEGERPNVTTETLLMFASRAQLVEKIIEKLDAGITVICDRWHFSTYAYQCGGKDFPVWAYNYLLPMLGLDKLKPDLVIYMKNSGEEKEPDDVQEKEWLPIRDKIGKAYDTIFLNDHRLTPKHLLCIDRNGHTPEQDLATIVQYLKQI